MALLRHTRVGTHFYDIPGSGRSLTTYPGHPVGTREQSQHIFDGDVPFLKGQLAMDISTKSSVTLFTPDPAQANTHPKIKIDELPLVRSPRLLGVYLDTIFSFNTHCVQVANRVSKRNKVLKALAGTNWGKQNAILLMTYKALGKKRINENLTAH